MPSSMDLLMQTGFEQSPRDHGQSNTDYSSGVADFLEEELGAKAATVLPELANIVHHTASFVDDALGNPFLDENERELIDAKIQHNNAKIAADAYLNPATAGTAQFAVDALPYLLTDGAAAAFGKVGGAMLKPIGDAAMTGIARTGLKGAVAADDALNAAKVFGYDTIAKRYIANGMDDLAMHASNRSFQSQANRVYTADKIAAINAAKGLENTMLGKASGALGDLAGRTAAYTGTGVVAHDMDVDEAAMTGATIAGLGALMHGINAGFKGGKSSSADMPASGRVRRQYGDKSYGDVNMDTNLLGSQKQVSEPKRTGLDGDAPAEPTVSPKPKPPKPDSGGNAKEWKPEDSTASGPKKQMHIEPGAPVNGEIKDFIDRNNLDTELLRNDIQEVFENAAAERRPTLKEAIKIAEPEIKAGKMTVEDVAESLNNVTMTKPLGKPNKKLQLDIEHALMTKTLPKTKQARQVLGHLMASSRYRNNELNFIPHSVAKKLIEGKPITQSDEEKIRANVSYMNAKQTAQARTIEDKKLLMSKDTPPDMLIELFNKYSGGKPLNQNFINELRKSPEAMQWQRQITLDNIIKDEKAAREIDETKAVKGSERDPNSVLAREAEAANNDYGTSDVDDMYTSNTIGDNEKSTQTGPAKSEIETKARREQIHRQAPAIKKSMQKIKPKAKGPIKDWNAAKKLLRASRSQSSIDDVVKRSKHLYDALDKKYPEKAKRWREMVTNMRKGVEERTGEKPNVGTKNKPEATKQEKPVNDKKIKHTAPEDEGGYKNDGYNKNRYMNDKDGDTGVYTGSHKRSMSQAKDETMEDTVEPEAKSTETREEFADRLIQENRDYISKQEGTTGDTTHGEVGAEQLEYKSSLHNPAKEYDAESARLFTKPKPKSEDVPYNVAGYYEFGDIFMNAQMAPAKGFTAYVHESFHKILESDMLPDLEKSFKKDFVSGNRPPIMDEIDILSNGKDSFTKYEEAVVYIATSKFVNNLPDKVKERLGYTSDDIDYYHTKYDDASSDMRSIVDSLVQKADKALSSKGNELNMFAYGSEPTIADKLDKIGSDAINSMVDSALELIPDMDKLASKMLNAENYNRYRFVKDKMDELYHNVMSQANELPEQKFIDKYTSIARKAEETGREVSQVMAKKVKELVPDKTIREQLTSPIMRKEAYKVKDEILSARGIGDLQKPIKELEEIIKPYTSGKISKFVEQTIKGLSTVDAMNSPYWKNNANQILALSPRFRTLYKNDKVAAGKVINALDKYMSLRAINSEDLNIMHKIDKSALSELMELQRVNAATSRAIMENPDATFTKGYKPSLYRKNYEFASKEQAMADIAIQGEGAGWIYAGNGLYYREALPEIYTPGMVPDKPHMAKGHLEKEIDLKGPELFEYARASGFGIVYTGGGLRLRKQLSPRARKLLDDNIDIAENMAAMSERNVHEKMAKDGAAGFVDGLIDLELVKGIEAIDNKMYEHMSEDVVSNLPAPIKKALMAHFGGRDKIYIQKRYKQQILGAKNRASLLENANKYGANFTHNAILNELKMWNMTSETTNWIKQKIILNNPVVITGNLLYGNVIALAEGTRPGHLLRFQKEAVVDFNKYQKLRKIQIELYIDGKMDTAKYKEVKTKLENNLAFKMFAEGDGGVGGIDRNLILDAVRDKDYSKKHIEKMFTDILGGPDSFGYKAASEVFITPQSKVGGAMIRALNYVDYMNRSVLVRTYMKKGMSFEDAARKANSKTVSFSKALPSWLRTIENRGFDYFLTWTLRNGVGVGKSMMEHPARWAALLGLYYLVSDEDEQRHGARYIGDVRVSSFNPGESFDIVPDMGIYKGLWHDGIKAVIPAVETKIAEGRNPVITTR